MCIMWLNTQRQKYTEKFNMYVSVNTLGYKVLYVTCHRFCRKHSCIEAGVRCSRGGQRVLDREAECLGECTDREIFMNTHVTFQPAKFVANLSLV